MSVCAAPGIERKEGNVPDVESELILLPLVNEKLTLIVVLALVSLRTFNPNRI